MFNEDTFKNVTCIDLPDQEYDRTREQLAEIAKKALTAIVQDLRTNPRGLIGKGTLAQLDLYIDRMFKQFLSDVLKDEALPSCVLKDMEYQWGRIFGKHTSSILEYKLTMIGYDPNVWLYTP